MQVVGLIYHIIHAIDSLYHKVVSSKYGKWIIFYSLG